MLINIIRSGVIDINRAKKMLLCSFSFCILSILLTGCQQKTYYFKGEGEYWEGSYTSNQTSDTEHGEFMFGYKGEGKEKVGEVVYEITSNSGSSSGNINVSGRTFTDSNACSGCVKTNEDEEFKVVIKWDGKKDEFILKR